MLVVLLLPPLLSLESRDDNLGRVFGEVFLVVDVPSLSVGSTLSTISSFFSSFEVGILSLFAGGCNTERFLYCGECIGVRLLTIESFLFSRFVLLEQPPYVLLLVCLNSNICVCCLDRLLIHSDRLLK